MKPLRADGRGSVERSDRARRRVHPADNGRSSVERSDRARRRVHPADNRRRLLVASLALWGALSGCLSGAKLEDHEYACRAPSDCISGYFCHPLRYICVKIGTSTTTVDAGELDAGLLDVH